MTGFVIHALPVLRGILAIAPMPGSGGDYAGDLVHLKDWQPAMVMTMTTSAEMVAAGAGKLGQDVGFMGSRWAHVATPDNGVPDAEAMRSWARAEPIALSALRGGGRVLIHCKGGCGRSGMAALRLMIAAGDAPETALKRLRALRPCAVETSAQMRWAQKGGSEATDTGRQKK